MLRVTRLVGGLSHTRGVRHPLCQAVADWAQYTTSTKTAMEKNSTIKTLIRRSSSVSIPAEARKSDWSTESTTEKTNEKEELLILQ